MTTPNELRALIAKATPGPWVAALSDHPSGSSPYSERFAFWTNKGPRCVTVDKSTCIAADDAELIVALRNSILPLLDELEGMRREREGYRQQTSSACAGLEHMNVKLSMARATIDGLALERDQARQELEGMRGVLREARDTGKHSVHCYRHQQECEGDSCICGWGNTSSRIHAAISPKEMTDGKSPASGSEVAG